MDSEPDTFICGICGEVQPVSERTVFDGKELCANCLSEYTAPCSHCGQLVWADNNSHTQEIPLCLNCQSYGSAEISPADTLTELAFWLGDLGACSSWKINQSIFLDRTQADVLAADDSEAFSSMLKCKQAAEHRLDRAYREAQRRIDGRTCTAGPDSFYQEFRQYFDQRLDTLRQKLKSIRTPENAAAVEEALRRLNASEIHTKARKIIEELLKNHRLPSITSYYDEIHYETYDPSEFESGVYKLIAKGFKRYGFSCYDGIRRIEADTQELLDSFQADFNSRIQDEILSDIVEPVQALLLKF